MGISQAIMGMPGVLGGGFTYYVDGVAGNDSTGDGSASAPWATLSKALVTVPIAGNVNIFLAAGAYAENTGGAGYLSITRAFEGWVHIWPWHSGDSVTITDSAGVDYCVRYAGGTHIHWHNVTIEQSGANSLYTVVLENNAATKFTGCTITARNIGIFTRQTTYTVTVDLYACTLTKRADISSGAVRCIDMRARTGSTVLLTMTNCTVNTISTSEEAAAVTLGKNTEPDGVFSASITGGTVTNTGGAGIFCNGGTINISDVTVATQTVQSIVIGRNTSPAFTTTGSVVNCTLSSVSSHGAEIGFGADGVTMTGTTVNGGDYGLVLKECTNVAVSLSVLNGGVGAGAGCYLKAANNTSVTDCEITADKNSVLLVGINPETSHANHDNIITDNELIATGTADIFDWGDDTEDSGGSVCDRNTYDVSGTSGDIGLVRGTDNIANLAALQAAWSTYDVPTNDANSTVVS